MTAIPPPRPGQFRARRRQSREQRKLSIDELVNDWKSDEASYSSSPALSVLLEDGSDDEEDPGDVGSEEGMPGYSYTPRSSSSESVPSLERDDRSALSSFGVSSPRTPPDLAGRRTSSPSHLKGSLRGRSLRLLSEATSDHPLAAPPSSSSPAADDDDDLLLTPPGRSSTPSPHSSFTSNLTLSLRRLKAAVTLPTLRFATAPSQRATTTSRFSDATLWSHPYLFPRLTAEIRPPTIAGTPSEAQRRYLNPNNPSPKAKPRPLTFEEQEAPFQLALHAPYLAEAPADLPAIQMQTYGGRRKAQAQAPTRRSPDPDSEAGRALAAAAAQLVAAGARQREPRENSDFLRVVVLEMNMRREGKLEAGRARIWLPPRRGEGGVAGGEREEEEEDEDEERRRRRRQGKERGDAGVPRRWRGVSAY